MSFSFGLVHKYETYLHGLAKTIYDQYIGLTIRRWHVAWAKENDYTDKNMQNCLRGWLVSWMSFTKGLQMCNVSPYLLVLCLVHLTQGLAAMWDGLFSKSSFLNESN